MADATDDAKWPAYFYGPNGEPVLCESKDDIPKGYADAPPYPIDGTATDAQIAAAKPKASA